MLTMMKHKNNYNPSSLIKVSLHFFLRLSSELGFLLNFHSVLSKAARGRPKVTVRKILDSSERKSARRLPENDALRKNYFWVGQFTKSLIC